jgi:hypothetical protein
MGMNSCSGLRFQPGTGILFAVGFDGSHDALFTVNPATGITTLVADVTVTGPVGGGCSAAIRAIPDITFRSDGTLFAPVIISGTFVICLATINPTTAALTFIGNTGDTHSGGNGLAFDASDTLWHGGEISGPGFIDTLDQTTGGAGTHTTLTISSPICTTATPDALAFNSAGTLYTIMNCGSSGSGPTYLATINTSTGGVTDVGSTGINTIMDGIAFSPAVVGGYMVPIDRMALLWPWLAIIGILSCAVVVVAVKKHHPNNHS